MITIEPAAASIGIVYSVGIFAILIQKYVHKYVYFSLMFLTLFTPFIVNEEETQIRALNTLLSVYYFSRLSQLHGSWDSYFGKQPLIVRFGHVYLTFHDSRIRKILPAKKFDITSFKQLVTTSFLTAFSVIILRKYGSPTTIFGVAFSCIVSGCIGYLSLSIMCALLRFLARLTGRK